MNHSFFYVCLHSGEEFYYYYKDNNKEKKSISIEELLELKNDILVKLYVNQIIISN